MSPGIIGCALAAVHAHVHCCHPLRILKSCRLLYSCRYTGMLNALRRIPAEEGVAALYKGYVCTSAGNNCFSQSAPNSWSLCFG